MDKALFIFIVIGVGSIYFITNFVKSMEEEGVQSTAEHHAQYHSLDSTGQDILDLSGADEKIQMAVWQASPLKKEFLALFPDYLQMKNFAKERIRGGAFQAKITKTIDYVEGEFFSGTLSAGQAKKILDTLQIAKASY